MPTTSKGLRYPASSAAPNVPQDIQNLAGDVNTRFAGFTAYSTGWPTSTIAGTNNIPTNNISIPAMSTGFVMVISVNCLITASGTSVPNLQLVVNGSIKAQDLYNGLTGTNANYTRGLSRSIYVSNGAAQTVAARVDIPAGSTVTTYTDDTHSYLTVLTVPVW